MQRPLAPQESAKHYVTPTGFAMRLFAAEPDLGGKPIAMAWDERGRLWVCESVDYPNRLEATGRGRDRIRICEDVDSDGKADQFTVFATDLSIPTAIAFHRGGAIVQNGAQTLFLKDTDGDDLADVRQVLISGWATNDTHGGVSNFHYGLDNRICPMQGYNRSTPRFGDAQTPPFRMGFFRFQLDDRDPPNVTDVEFLRSTDNNT
jgi:putative membrane-bound dehydrogenase-like protein